MTSLPDSILAGNGVAAGEALRDQALYRLSTTRPATIRRLQRAAVRLALETGTVTADDLREAVPIPAGINPKVNGAAVHGLAVLGILTGGEYVKSRRAVAHRRPIQVWRLANAATAARWLAANPEYPDPTI